MAEAASSSVGLGALDDDVDISTIMLVTANVGSIFEYPEKMLPIWTREFLSMVARYKPHFIALHCQEVGGKNYEQSMQHVDTFVKNLLKGDGFHAYNRCRVYLDEDFTSTDTFTALGSFYFVHKSVLNVQTWDFTAGKLVEVSGREVHAGNIEDVPLIEKDKFPYDMFPECKWSRKGFMRTRWSLNGTQFDLVNIHLFHDASNLVSMEKFPSSYSCTRRLALEHTLDRFRNDDLDNVPLFIFGDFNFRLDTQGVVRELTQDLLEVKKDPLEDGANNSNLQFKNTEAQVILTLGKKKFDLTMQEEVFIANSCHWFRRFDHEVESLSDDVEEFEVNFPPSYPYEEMIDPALNAAAEAGEASGANGSAATVSISDDEVGKRLMKTRCPAWCDRVLMTPPAMEIVRQGQDNQHEIMYSLIGQDVCMGDHKPIFLKFNIALPKGTLNRLYYNFLSPAEAKAAAWANKANSNFNSVGAIDTAAAAAPASPAHESPLLVVNPSHRIPPAAAATAAAAVTTTTSTPTALPSIAPSPCPACKQSALSSPAVPFCSQHLSPAPPSDIPSRSNNNNGNNMVQCILVQPPTPDYGRLVDSSGKTILSPVKSLDSSDMMKDGKVFKIGPATGIAALDGDYDDERPRSAAGSSRSSRDASPGGGGSPKFILNRSISEPPNSARWSRLNVFQQQRATGTIYNRSFSEEHSINDGDCNGGGGFPFGAAGRQESDRNLPLLRVRKFSSRILSHHSSSSEEWFEEVNMADLDASVIGSPIPTVTEGVATNGHLEARGGSPDYVAIGASQKTELRDSKSSKDSAQRSFIQSMIYSPINPPTENVPSVNNNAGLLNGDGSDTQNPTRSSDKERSSAAEPRDYSASLTANWAVDSILLEARSILLQHTIVASVTTDEIIDSAVSRANNNADKTTSSAATTGRQKLPTSLSSKTRKIALPFLDWSIGGKRRSKRSSTSHGTNDEVGLSQPGLGKAQNGAKDLKKKKRTSSASDKVTEKQRADEPACESRVPGAGDVETMQKLQVKPYISDFITKRNESALFNTVDGESGQQQQRESRNGKPPLIGDGNRDRVVVNSTANATAVSRHLDQKGQTSTTIDDISNNPTAVESNPTADSVGNKRGAKVKTQKTKVHKSSLSTLSSSHKSCAKCHCSLM